MILRSYLTVSVGLIVLAGLASSERWSRQVSNSEWIPLADPRNNRIQQIQAGSSLLTASSANLPPLTLPPELQQQYQQQLLQLQKTQENIQKLLLLQQQLKAQQQLLQSQAYVPSEFGTGEGDKLALHQSAIANAQHLPDLAPEVLVPPIPSSDALPPVYAAQNFHSQGAPASESTTMEDEISNTPTGRDQDFRNVQTLKQVVTQEEPSDTDIIQDTTREFLKQQKQRPQTKRLKTHGGQSSNMVVPPSAPSAGDEEEIQLVYVPAETLAQRNQPKRPRGRKPFLPRHQQSFKENQSPSGQEAYTQHFLQNLQQEHDDKAKLLNEERAKELARLNEEQRVIQAKAQLEQENLRREQERQRQVEIAKKQKELEEIEEMARLRELERLRNLREKQRQLELKAEEERKKQQEENRQKEHGRITYLQKPHQLGFEQGSTGGDNLHNAKPTPPSHDSGDSIGQALPLIREQPYHQHLTETFSAKTNKLPRLRNRPRLKTRPFQEQEEPTTTPSPNQPPLSIYMAASDSTVDTIRVTDVLKQLKNAKTIAVLDTIGSDAPRVFVGPANLETPIGYAKFELPYLSSLDHNRVERKVDRLPFFVAPLSFEPPSGYSKIPFPAPHIGSVVVNTLDGSPDSRNEDDRNPNPTPLIEPNSYIDGNREEDRSESTTASYETPTTAVYSQKSSTTPRYESSHSTLAGPTTSTGSRFRFRQFYNEDKPSQSSTSASPRIEQTPTVRAKSKPYEDFSSPSPSPVSSPKIATAVSYSEEVSYQTTPVYHREEPTRPAIDYRNENRHPQQQQHYQQHHQQHQQQQLMDLNRFRPIEQEEYYRENLRSPTKLTTAYGTEASLGDDEDSRNVVNPTQYSLPAELPAISPHLPGLVNSLIEHRDLVTKTVPSISSSVATTTTPAPATTIPTTTTTTTSAPPTTTYRPRGRQRGRVSSTRTTTTLSPTGRSTVDRTRRPSYNRSRSRFTTTTTTEDYKNADYESTRGKYQETTPKYTVSEHSRRPTTRSQRFRTKEKTTEQPETFSVQTQQPTGFENTLTRKLSASSSALRRKNQQQQLDQYPQNDYPATGSGRTENYPPFREVANTENIENAPVNDFNYNIDEEVLNSTPQRPKEFQGHSAKYEEFSVPTSTGSAGLNVEHEVRDYSQSYDTATAQTPIQSSHYTIISEKPTGDPIEEPILVQYGQDKTEYASSVRTTEPAIETTTQPPVSSTPVIIRQRVRARLGGNREHHQDSVIQTRPRGSQDEYVRFSAVNQESGRGSSGSRRGSRPRSNKPRPQNHTPQVQTEGNEHIRISAVNQHRPIVPSTPASVPQVPQAFEEDADYGFIRAPSFRPSQQIENQYQSAPARQSTPSFIEPEETLIEQQPIQAQLVNNRPKYQQIPNRRPLDIIDQATTTESALPVTIPQEESVYTSKPRASHDDDKNRVRIRARRPGKKRVTTTTSTELPPDVNELPLEENYPRISIAQRQQIAQRAPYSENYEGPSRYVSIRRPVQYEEPGSENYSSQDFQLNLENLPSTSQEYDQSQSNAGQLTGDIYGAESQWSTKLTKSSFQPSFSANNIVDNSKDVSRSLTDEHAPPEIITASPDDSSVSVVVTANVGGKIEEPTSPKSELGAKTSADDESKTDSIKKSDSLPRKIVRRKRIRVRVRPLPDDFVTSESQHYRPSLNNLPERDPKSRDEETRTTTMRPTLSSLVEKESSGSMLKEFLEEMLKSGEEPSPGTTTSEVPSDVWSTESRTEAPSTTIDDLESEARATSTEPQTTVAEESEDARNVDGMRSTTIVKSSYEHKEFMSHYYDETKHDDDENSKEDPSSERDSERSASNAEERKESSDSSREPEEARDSMGYPKNHRTEWSEVRQPNEVRDYVGWGRKNLSIAEPTTPGSVETTASTEEAKALSDYVQAIFDSMKSADEAESGLPNGFAERRESKDHETSSTSKTYEAKDFTTTPEAKTEIVTMPPTSTTSEKNIAPSNVTMNNFGITKLGKILRTSTTTKVSHMTEICYRGKCVMTKPKREVRA